MGVKLSIPRIDEASKASECAELLAELVTFQNSATSVCLQCAIFKATLSNLTQRSKEYCIRFFLCASLRTRVVESLKTGSEDVNVSAFRGMNRLLRLSLRSRKKLLSWICDNIVEVL